MRAIVTHFADAADTPAIFGTGFRLAGDKYLTLKADSRSLYGRQVSFSFGMISLIARARRDCVYVKRSRPFSLPITTKVCNLERLQTPPSSLRTILLGLDTSALFHSSTYTTVTVVYSTLTPK